MCAGLNEVGEPHGTPVGDGSGVLGIFNADTCFFRTFRSRFLDGEWGGEPGDPNVGPATDRDNKVFENTLAWI